MISINENDFYELTFHHKIYEWIKFGIPQCCTYMIYIACVDEYNSYFSFSNEQIQIFLAVKDQLITDGRLNKDAKIEMMLNCCS